MEKPPVLAATRPLFTKKVPRIPWAASGPRAEYCTARPSSNVSDTAVVAVVTAELSDERTRSAATAARTTSSPTTRSAQDGDGLLEAPVTLCVVCRPLGVRRTPVPPVPQVEAGIDYGRMREVFKGLGSLLYFSLTVRASVKLRYCGVLNAS
jgi:hypothetical protein